MGNPSQLVQFAFAAGIDQSQRDEVLEPSSGFLNLENVRQNKRGGISKRNGFTYQTLSRLDATSRSSGRRLFAHDKQTCVIDSSNTLDSYSTASACSVNRGRVSGCEMTMMSVPSSGVPTGSTEYSYVADLAICGNYAVLLYQIGTNGDMYAAVIDKDTGTTLREPEILWTGTNARKAQLATYSTYVFAVSIDNSSNNLQYRYINTSSAANITTGWVATANAATDANSSSTFSTCGLSDRVAVAYGNNGGGTSRLTIMTLNTSGSVQTQTINTSSTTPGKCATQGSSSDTLWVAWNEATAIKLIGVSPTSLSTTVATTATVITTTANPSGRHDIDIMSSGSTAGAGVLFCNDPTSSKSFAQSFTTSAGAVTVGGVGTLATVYNCKRLGRPFTTGGRYYAVCTPIFTATTNNYAVVCDLTEATPYVRPVANILSGTAGLQLEQARVTESGGVFYVPIAERRDVDTGIAVKIAKLNFSSSQAHETARFAGLTFIGGGSLDVYDGSAVYEAGFVVRPTKPSTADSGGGSGPNGAYRYVITYEHISRSGHRWISGVSDPSDSLSVVDNTITVTVRTLGISGRLKAATDSNVRVCIYRTVAGGSPPYYFLASLDNITSAATTTYSDSTTDTVLSANAKLYAPSLPGVNGSAQDRRTPPGLSHIVNYNGMLVGSHGPDLWYSGQEVYGEGPWFNPVFQVPVSGDGDITGLAAQDGTLFVFTRRAIYAVSGEAPSDNGSSGGLGTPRRLAVDVGCTDARSIVVTSLGVFFQSERGIELLTRSQSVAWIGEQVQDTVASYPVCSAATLDTTANVVYFELAASESSGLVSGNGRTLVYDLSMGQWASVDRRASYAGVADTPAQSAAMIWDGTTYRYAWLQTNGYVRPEQSTYLDSGSSDTWVTMLAETGWVKVSGIQGKQMFNKAMLLAKKSTRADIGLALAYDYDASYETATVVAANTIDTLSSSLARVQLEHIAHDDAEGQAVRLKVYDATPTGGTVSTGQGATWVALTFDVTPRAGAAEVPDTAR